MGYSLMMENSQLLHLYSAVAGGGGGMFSVPEPVMLLPFH